MDETSQAKFSGARKTGFLAKFSGVVLGGVIVFEVIEWLDPGFVSKIFQQLFGAAVIVALITTLVYLFNRLRKRKWTATVEIPSGVDVPQDVVKTVPDLLIWSVGLIAAFVLSAAPLSLGAVIAGALYAYVAPGKVSKKRLLLLFPAALAIVLVLVVVSYFQVAAQGGDTQELIQAFEKSGSVWLKRTITFTFRGAVLILAIVLGSLAGDAAFKLSHQSR